MANQTPDRQDEKQRVLGLAFSQIEKQFGKGAIMRLGESQAMDIPVISSGSLALDIALGVGGLPRGRIIEIYGPEASGKNHPGPARRCLGTEERRRGRFYRRRAHALDPTYARASWA